MITKWPETEVEYWACIDGLGGYVWKTNHDLSHNRYESSRDIENSLVEARDEQLRLVKEIEEKFGVVQGAPRYYPHDNRPTDYPEPPEGKRWYWDWYYAMKLEAWRPEYENSVCGCCPYCNGGLEGYAYSPSIPCSLFRGMLSRLSNPGECEILSTRWGSSQMPEEEFLSKMADEHGQDTADKWRRHREDVRNVKQVL
jgi:hypothetical protein